MGVHERRQRDFRRREAELLEAALAMLDHDRWLTVTIDQIAEAAEIGKGTVYKHFTSKDELYARLALAFHEGLLATIRTIDLTGGTERAMRRAAEVVAHAYRRPSRYGRIVAYCDRADFRRLLPDELRRTLAVVQAELFDAFLALVRRGQAEGLWSLLPPREHVYAVLAVLTGSPALADLDEPRGSGPESAATLAVDCALALLHRQAGQFPAELPSRRTG